MIHKAFYTLDLNSEYYFSDFLFPISLLSIFVNFFATFLSDILNANRYRARVLKNDSSKMLAFYSDLMSKTHGQ